MTKLTRILLAISIFLGIATVLACFYINDLSQKNKRLAESLLKISSTDINTSVDIAKLSTKDLGDTLDFIKQVEENYEKELKRQEDAQEQAVQEYNEAVESENARRQNVYKSDTPIYADNTVQLNPSVIFYDENGGLYVLCFVTNGHNSFAYDINIENFSLYDANENLIASKDNTYIGDNKGIPSKSYNLWVFEFSKDEVKQADLTNIKWTSQVTNKF